MHLAAIATTPDFLQTLLANVRKHESIASRYRAIEKSGANLSSACRNEQRAMNLPSIVMHQKHVGDRKD